MENDKKLKGLPFQLPLWLPGPLGLVGFTAAVLGLGIDFSKFAAWGLLLGVLYGLLFQLLTVRALAGGRRLRWVFILKIVALVALLYAASQAGTQALLAFPCGFLIMRLDFMQKASHR